MHSFPFVSTSSLTLSIFLNFPPRGRTLDYCARTGEISYRNVIREGLAKDGMAAFFTAPKWFSRVLMNAPAQGVLPWFYNEILPLGEDSALRFVKKYIYTSNVKVVQGSILSIPVNEKAAAQPLANIPWRVGKQ